MTNFPRSSRLLKGAIVAVDPDNPLASVIAFQYNPSTLTCSLEPQMAGEAGGARSEALRLKGALLGTISQEVTTVTVDPLASGPGQRRAYSIVSTATASTSGGSPIRSVRVTPALAQRHRQRAYSLRRVSSATCSLSRAEGRNTESAEETRRCTERV